MKRIAAAAVLCAGLALAGCHSGAATHSPVANPTVSAALSHDAQKGITRLENCLPNGHAVVPAVLNRTASLLTYLQLAKAFHGSNLQRTEQACLPPGKHPARAFGACLKGHEAAAVSKAVAPWQSHPFRYRHQIEMATGEATVTTAASCLGGEL